MIGRKQRKRVVYVDGIPIESTLLDAGESGLKGEEKSDPTSLTALDPRALFDKYDTDGSGDIDFEEFKVLLHDLSVKLTEPKARAYFKRCDRRRRGCISFDEFRLALYTCDPKNPERTGGFAPGQSLAPKDLFEMFDKEEEGAIDRGTFMEVLEFIGHKMPLDKMEALFADYEDPELEMMPYLQFKKAWLSVVDVQAELRQRGERFNRFLPPRMLAKKLAMLVTLEEKQEALTLLEANNTLSDEAIAAQRRELVKEAHLLARVTLAEALDAAGQVYVFGKGAYQRFDSEPREPDFVEFMEYGVVRAKSIHGNGDDNSNNSNVNGEKRSSPSRTKLETSARAFASRQVSKATAFLWELAKPTRMALLETLGECIELEIECVGSKFHDHLKRQDQIARRYRKERREKPLMSIVLKVNALWFELGDLRDKMAKAERNRLITGDEEYDNMKHKITTATQKLKRRARERHSASVAADNNKADNNKSGQGGVKRGEEALLYVNGGAQAPETTDGRKERDKASSNNDAEDVPVDLWHRDVYSAQVIPALGVGAIPAKESFTVAPMVLSSLISLGVRTSSSGPPNGGGYVYVAGSNNALDKFTPRFARVMIEDASSAVMVTKASCGPAHTALVSTEGELYTWGKNVGGSTGHAVSIPLITQPTRVGCMFERPRNLCLDEAATASQSSQNASAIAEHALGARSTLFNKRSAASAGGPKYALMVSEDAFDPELRGKQSLAKARAQSVHMSLSGVNRNELTWVTTADTFGSFIRVQLESSSGASMLGLERVEVLGSSSEAYVGPRVSDVVCAEAMTVAICTPLSGRDELREKFQRAARADRASVGVLAQLETFHPFVKEEVVEARAEEALPKLPCVICEVEKQKKRKKHSSVWHSN
uniref:EF-hand domain-containing protein n=1 Tax=Phytophthora ramorum TaxID=164328 RepID=H3HD63_PHYRM